MDALERDTALIRALVQYAEASPAAVAKRANVAVTTVNRPYNGTAPSRLGRAALDKLRAAFPDFPGWPEYLGQSVGAIESDLVEVAVSDVSYGMGGAIVDDETSHTSIERFPRSFIRQFTKGPFAKLYFATGIGDSMQPTIHHNDLVLIDRSQDALRLSDQLWAIHASSVGMIKRVRVLPDGSVLLVSDNPDVGDYPVGQDELHLIGRVVAVVKRL